MPIAMAMPINVTPPPKIVASGLANRFTLQATITIAEVRSPR
jgi:hypothetical protein